MVHMGLMYIQMLFVYSRPVLYLDYLKAIIVSKTSMMHNVVDTGNWMIFQILF